MEGLGLANSATTCACTRPTAEQAFCSPCAPATARHGWPATRMRASAAHAPKPRDTDASDNAPTDARHRRRRRVSGASWQRRSVARATAAQPDSHTASRALAAEGRTAHDDLAELVLRSAATRPDLAMTSASRMKGLTFDMSGSPKLALGCPLDGGVSPHWTRRIKPQHNQRNGRLVCCLGDDFRRSTHDNKPMDRALGLCVNCARRLPT
jgi:hypothetical protein